MADVESFQALQRTLVREGFDTSFNAWREGAEAVSSLKVSLHQEQTPEVMAKLSELITGSGFAFTAEGETVHITARS